MRTEFENELKEIECEGLELEEIGREEARTSSFLSAPPDFSNHIMLRFLFPPL